MTPFRKRLHAADSADGPGHADPQLRGQHHRLLHLARRQVLPTLRQNARRTWPGGNPPVPDLSREREAIVVEQLQPSGLWPTLSV